MRFVAPSVHTSLSEEIGVSSQNTGKHISVALANQFVSYIYSLANLEYILRGKPFFPSQIVCSAWPNFCLRCYEAFNYVLCEV